MMNEEQMEENEIKEGHNDVAEKQDNKPRVFRLMGIGISSFLYCSRYTSRYFVMEEGQIEEYKKKERQKKVCSEAVICNFVIKEGQMEEYKKKERQKEAKETPFANRKLLLLEKITNNERNEMEEGEMEENEIKEGHDDVEEKQGNNLRIAINNMKTFDDIRPLEASLDMFKEVKLCQQMNRKLLLEEITNNERKAMEERQMEKNEIKERHEDVGEKQNNKAEETPIANRKLLLEKITNNKRNEMEEEPLEEIEVKEGHEDVEEEQDNVKMKILKIIVIVNIIEERQEDVQEEQDKEKMKLFRIMVIVNIIAERQEDVQEEQDKEFLNDFDDQCLDDFDDMWNIRRIYDIMLAEDIGKGWQLQKLRVRQGRRKQFFRKGRNRRDQLKTVKESEYALKVLELEKLGIRTEDRRYVVLQGDAQKERGKLIDNPEDLSGVLFDAGKGLGITHFGPPPHFDSSLDVFKEERRTKTKLDEIIEDWFKTEGKRYVVLQGDTQKEREKLIDNPEELSGELDDAEKEILELEQLLRCKVCLDSDACIVFFPCRHMATCENCEVFLYCCPVCRSFIEEAVKINEE